MLSAMGLVLTPAIQRVQFNGTTVDAVKDQYVLRMPQLNAATSTSVLDYASRQPAIRKNWSIDALGGGFYKLSAPGASVTNVMAWAAGQQALYIEPNAVHRAAGTPNDPLYTSPDNWAFPRIKAEKGWDTSTGSRATIVAVLDTGIDYNHVDLVDNMWKNPNETPGNGIDDDTNGVIDDIFGFNAFTNGGDPMDDNGHGTFSAGLIGAVGNNSLGMAGTNWNVRMMGVKVLDSNGIGTTASIIAGANYVTREKIAGQAISTVSCGFARAGYNQAEFDAFQQLGATGVVIVCAAGNEGNDNDVNPRYPANFDIPSLISVAATTRTDDLAPFSNFGATTVDLGAPGIDLLSTRAALAKNPPFAPYTDPNYSVASGTSYSAALVAGTAALLKAVKPTASAAEIKNAILVGADTSATLTGLVATGGRLSVVGAVNQILSTVAAKPVASFKVGQVTQYVEGNAGYTIADVRVVLDRPVDPGQTAAVFYETRPGGSAFSNVDFVAQSGYVTFSGSQTERVFRLRIIGDRIPEPNEQFAVSLVPARTRGATVGDSQINIGIIDDDFNVFPSAPEPTNVLQPRVSIAPMPDGDGNPVNVNEGDDAQFLVRLDRVSDQTITVNYRTNEPIVAPINHALAGSDYVEQAGTLTFRPGESAKVISIKTLKDNLREVYSSGTPGVVVVGSNNGNSGSIDYEFFSVVLSEPANAVLAGTAATTFGLIHDVAPAAPKPPPGGGGFTITVNFTSPSNLTASQQAMFAQAATRWEQIIIGDLPDVVDPATGQTIDDVVIDASATPIDGVNGVLGQAGPTKFRQDATGLPWKGVMQFDTADLAALEQSGQLVDVITHEMGHVLGFGTIWDTKQLLNGAGSQNPTFVGANAVREYNSLFGTTGTSVPVENLGGPGTADGHWRESVFGSELMTGFLNDGVKNQISRVTVGQFQDLGYQVDFSKADAFVPIRGLVQGTALPIRLPGTVVPIPLTSGAAPSAPTGPRVPVTRTPVATQQPASTTPAPVVTVVPQRTPVTRSAAFRAVRPPAAASPEPGASALISQKPVA